MLSNMRLCSNVPAQAIVQTALGGYQSVEEYLVPGGEGLYDRENVFMRRFRTFRGFPLWKQDAAFYIFPKIDTKRFNITNDEQFALDLLREKRILIVQGSGFNWVEPDHFRIVYLPRKMDLIKAMHELGDFLETYHQN